VQQVLRMKSNNAYYERVCGITRPACNANATYCHLWYAPGYNIFHILINGKISENVTEHKVCVLSIFTQLLPENIFMLRRN
jgi:hypothetical protein